MLGDESTFNKKKLLRFSLALFGGFIAGSGWMTFIDANIFESHNDLEPAFMWYFYFPIIATTLGLVMTNIVDFELLKDGWIFGDNIDKRVRAWLFFSFFVTFCGVGGALWLSIERFFAHSKDLDPRTKKVGVEVLISSILVAIGSVSMAFARSRTAEEEDDGSAI